MLQTNRGATRPLYFAASILLMLSSVAARSQSGDAGHPTPVFAKEVSGRIAPRDVGDPRRTRHFYTFRGSEGDLSVTFDSTDLIGDVDVFTATTLRPLVKITLFGDPAHVTKSFYIRSQETLILRVEARAVGDTEGTYRISFSGSFVPAPPELANVQEPSEPTVSGRGGANTRRVTTTGARIVEPAAPPKEEAKEAKPTPSPTPTVESPSPARRTTAARRGRGARPSPSRTRARSTTPPASESASKPSTGENNTGEPKANTGETNSTEASTTTESKTESTAPAASPSTRAASPTTTARRRGARTTTRRRAPTQGVGGDTESASTPSSGAQPSNAEASPTQRLVIVTKSGEMIVRDMNNVRRVTVENNVLLVVTKDGKIIRQPMTNVERMSIEP